MLSTVYGCIPCGSQPAKTLTDPSNVGTPPSLRMSYVNGSADESYGEDVGNG